MKEIGDTRLYKIVGLGLAIGGCAYQQPGHTVRLATRGAELRFPVESHFFTASDQGARGPASPFTSPIKTCS